MGSLAEDLRRCMRRPEDDSAWGSFLDAHHGLLVRIVYRTAARFGIISRDAIEDAVQEVCLKISSLARLGKIQDYEDAPFEAYVKALVANAAHDYFRGERARKRDVLAEISLQPEISHRALANHDLENEVLLNQIQGLIA